MRRQRYKPNKDEFFFKKSSLACRLSTDQYGTEEVYIYDRKSNRILMTMSPAMVTLEDYMDLIPIKRKRIGRKK